jgi:hypothetical protein
MKKRIGFAALCVLLTIFSSISISCSSINTLKSQNTTLQSELADSNSINYLLNELLSNPSSSPRLIISPSAILTNGVLNFAGSNFISSTNIDINAVDSSGGQTQVASEVVTDSKGIFSGSTISINLPAGNYTLQATDVYGDKASATFAIVSPP